MNSSAEHAARRLGSHLFGPGALDFVLIAAGTAGQMTLDAVRGQADSILVERRDSQHYLRLNVAGVAVGVVLDVQGAAVAGDVVAAAAALGCRTGFFLGFAKSLRNHHIGDLIVPTDVVPLDGLTNWFAPEVILIPAPPETDRVVEALTARGVQIRRGRGVSVPFVLHCHTDVDLRLGQGDIDILDMEAAAALWFGQRRRVTIVPILVISDTPRIDLIASFVDREPSYARTAAHLLDLVRHGTFTNGTVSMS